MGTSASFLLISDSDTYCSQIPIVAAEVVAGVVAVHIAEVAGVAEVAQVVCSRAP